MVAPASNTHLPLWYSRAYHPEAIASNALLHQWTGLSLYVFSPFSATLAKIRVDGVEEVISHSPHMAEEVLVHPPTVDGM